MSAAIEVYNLGKQYRIGERRRVDRSFREAVSDWVTWPVRRWRKQNASDDALVWALRNVSFSVQHGEVIGIIGRNGAGKSTLLKVLSRITEPTTGRAVIRGRMGSLLEVGTGFHPELTGRENIYLNGAILGMRRAEISRKFDEIVAFSEVERFLDTPVKRYSSGMYVRLAFAVAAHLEPEILVVDEVLAVGDAAFQKKCLGKMGEVARQGRTVLFVSHNMEAVRRLCSRTVMLSDGQLVADGQTEETIAAYLTSGRRSETNAHRYEAASRPGDEYVQLRGIRLADSQGDDTGTFRIDDSIVVEIEYEVFKPIANFHNYLRVFTLEGTLLFGSADWDEHGLSVTQSVVGVHTARVTVPSHLLNFGRYSVTVMGVVPDVRYVYFEEHVLGFEVVAIGGAGEATSLHRPGLLRPTLPWTQTTHRDSAGTRQETTND